jgi:uncharacterized protein
MDNLCSGIIDLGSGLCNKSRFASQKARATRLVRLISMQLIVLSELRQPIGSVTTLSLNEPVVQVEGSPLRNLIGSLTLIRIDRGLLASLEASASIREKCARCLTESDYEVDIHFEEEFVPVTDANTSTRIHLSEDDDSFRIGPDFVLDLRDALRQYFLIAEPLKPLCKPDCAGLCPSCGSNLNEAECGCAPAADERWGALAGFEKGPSKGT